MTRREASLLRLVGVLWEQLRRIPYIDHQQLEHNIRAQGLGWALPESIDHIDDDDWLTPDQIAHALGYDVATIYTWARRYQLQQVKGTFRWGDIIARRDNRPDQQNDKPAIS